MEIPDLKKKAIEESCLASDVGVICFDYEIQRKKKETSYNGQNYS
jgi:hypothetical protein